MKTVQGKIDAFITSPTASVTDIEQLNFARCDMTDCGWIKVGEASISVELFDGNEIVKAQLDLLKAEKRKIQAELQSKLNAIDGRIQNLLALPA